ncbi:MAG: hypothetical protein AAGG75_05940 [Bacteroidota bacterium]
MKHFKVFLGLALLGLTLLQTACNNDDDNDGINVGGDGCNASWKVDGTNYSDDEMAGCLYIDSTLNLSSLIAGTSGDFFLQIDPITAPGTFTVDPVNNPTTAPNIVIFLRLNDNKQIVIRNGTVTVTELSNSKAMGTFSGTFFDIQDFTMTTSFSVTEGRFEADF